MTCRNKNEFKKALSQNVAERNNKRFLKSIYQKVERRKEQ